MSASKYKAGTRVAYLNHSKDAIVFDDIWLVRKGYYHMPSDDYLHDEDILGCIIDGKRIPNDLYIADRKADADRLVQEIDMFERWSTNIEVPIVDHSANEQ